VHRIFTDLEVNASLRLVMREKPPHQAEKHSHKDRVFHQTKLRVAHSIRDQVGWIFVVKVEEAEKVQ
jgi:hypothetical protein